MRRFIIGCFGAIVGCLALSFTSPATADEGMWLLTSPPLETLRSKYGFEPSAAWMEKMQKSAVRFSTGGSGSLVSANGLVMTNHHVASDMLSKLSDQDRDILRDGFMAASEADELACPDLELNVLWTIEDVTDRVNSGTEGMSASDAGAARRRAISAIEQEAGERSGLLCQVVTLYQGARYHLYAYKRFTDVRLVFAPEEGIAFFGGDTDNFEYPRYCLDVAFFRIYEDGKPYKPEHYLAWSRDGIAEDELGLVFGHPGTTRRLFTVDHLKFMRDVQLPRRLAQLWRREVQLTNFSNRSPEHRRIAREDFLGVQNSRKALAGQFDGLLDPAVMNEKARSEAALRSWVLQDPDRTEAWGSAWDDIAEAQKRHAGFFNDRSMDLSSSTLFRTALHLVRMSDELPKPSGDRLREYRDSGLESLRFQLFSPAPIHELLEIDILRSGLAQMAETLGGDHPVVQLALAGKSPRARAEELVSGTSLLAVEARQRLASGGSEAIATSTDPMIRLAAALDPALRRYRTRFENEVESVERQAYAKIAAAKFAFQGDSVYPDATFTLRMSFGPVKSYIEAGERIPAFTRLSGTFDRASTRAGDPAFKLPQRWIDAEKRIKGDVPFNFVMCADIIGGNSGSPVVNTTGEVVGLIFDGNLQSLPWAFAYDEREGRAVSVDSRGMMESFKSVYKADRLVNELLGGAK
ncbi:MAG: S46 family peptidase [Phycisphaeraceae bacterium]|nr:S46 family peptidase [Phycisphaeraceae bacterium]